MGRRSTWIQIPRDPRTDRTSFITEMPGPMVGRVPEDEWRQVMDGLNGVFRELEAPSMASLVKTVSVAPLLLGSAESAYARVSKYLEEANRALEAHGVRIIHPGPHQYVELEVEMDQDGS